MPGHARLRWSSQSPQVHLPPVACRSTKNECYSLKLVAAHSNINSGFRSYSARACSLAAFKRFNVFEKGVRCCIIELAPAGSGSYFKIGGGEANIHEAQHPALEGPSDQWSATTALTRARVRKFVTFKVVICVPVLEFTLKGPLGF